ncbi:hypothetical protein [Paraburkholderia caledonica]|uniref:Uncharacterized protein n=1 Tax=Paraburkholderia caledonica TaxID=134536 RepID=A0ABU1KZ05_9BURK|nr:hypothetical protein [Paraburkholderia caledonica]MDR6376214.1 hypothetical protein [Paraburkholderia caledonica]
MGHLQHLSVPLFFPAAMYWDCVHPSKRGSSPPFPVPTDIVGCSASDTSWLGFGTCHISIVDWNSDYPGPTFRSEGCNEESYIETVRVGATCSSKSPVQATGYLFNRRHEFLGLLDFRYFSERMSRTIDFNVKHLNLPASTLIQVRFQANGGGTPTVPSPPFVSSVLIEVTTRPQVDELKRPPSLQLQAT